jgi:hypothetical protein
MGRGILTAQLSRFDEIGELTEEKSAWKRREGFNLTYTFANAIKSACGIFLFQLELFIHPQGRITPLDS